VRQKGKHKLLATQTFGLHGTNLMGNSDTGTGTARDSHSFSEPHLGRVEHFHLELESLFPDKVLSGSVTLRLARDREDTERLTLDSESLSIASVEISHDGESYGSTSFEFGREDQISGTPLKITIQSTTQYVRIKYRTHPDASGLQWLEARQTATKKFPFLFTQSQEIHARSWIPLQDTPAVRSTFSARIKAPDGLTAVMGAEQLGRDPVDGYFTFRMDEPVPSYLVALAIGKLEFAATGPRTGVYSEPPILRRATEEFSDTEKMLRVAEELYGPYRWGRYDLLILPPSFPFGGMENPRVPFITPTIIAGDKSLVALIAHELAHSWSGNLVTNATWNDFWLNEGFTTYIEGRILEAVYGRSYAVTEEVLATQRLEEAMTILEPRDQILHINLEGRRPDEGATMVPYVKGALFLRRLEQLFGRESLDLFLRAYFDHFAFQSITTEQAIAYLKSELLEKSTCLSKAISLQEWIEEPGIPDSAPKAFAPALQNVADLAHLWVTNEIRCSEMQASSWSTQEWLHFLEQLPVDIGPVRMRELDDTYRLTGSSNCEILQKWLLLAIRNAYRPAFATLKKFLKSVGRRVYVKPLYEELVRTNNGGLARNYYKDACAGYHPVTRAAVERVLRVRS
jgi:leukotriene-A4 hydrolase